LPIKDDKCRGAIYRALKLPLFFHADTYKLFLVILNFSIIILSLSIVILSLSIVILSDSEESLSTDNEILRYRSE